MKIKTTGVLLCILLLTVGSISTAGFNQVSIEQKASQELEKIKATADENITQFRYIMATIGPVSKLFTKIEFTDGPEDQIDRAVKCMNRRIPLLARLLPFYAVNLTGVNFTVCYKRDVRNNSRFSYATLHTEIIYNETTGKAENYTNETSYFNKVHQIKVTNFTGVLVFSRARLFRGLSFCMSTRLFLIPATFVLGGGCDAINETVAS